MIRLTSVMLSVLFWSVSLAQHNDPGIYRTRTGKVLFVSDAPLELIRAESNELRGAVDTEKLTFAFQLEIRSLKGFNSDLQQEHFYENYLESDIYPVASFAGKIIEKVDFKKPGDIAIRAKGILKIHGIEQERIIPCNLSIGQNSFRVRSDFIVPLADYNITIPRLVYQKIAEEINVSIEADLNFNASE